MQKWEGDDCRYILSLVQAEQLIFTSVNENEYNLYYYKLISVDRTYEKLTNFE